MFLLVLFKEISSIDVFLVEINVQTILPQTHSLCIVNFSSCSFYMANKNAYRVMIPNKKCRYLLANCPAGSHYNAENASCVKCPVGTYQPVQGQKECIPCGNDLTTASNGTIEESDCFGMFVVLTI